MKARVSYAVMAGSLDVGPRLAMFHYFTSGWNQSYGSVNSEYWRRIIPTVAACALTSWMTAPLEIARAAYHGDRTFPQELRKGYNSPHQALFRMAATQPYALFKNSLPTVAASFVQNVFMFSLFDYLYDLFSPLFRDTDSSKGSVKLLLDKQLRVLCFLHGHRHVVPFGRRRAQ